MGAPEIKEGDVKTSTVEGNALLVVFHRLPERSQEILFIGKGKESKVGILGLIVIKVIRYKENLTFQGVGVHHGDAYDFSSEGPKGKLPSDFLPAERSLFGIGLALGRAKQIFETGVVEGISGEGRRFDVEYQGVQLSIWSPKS